MIARESVRRVVDPLRSIFPGYHPDAADINEALDLGVASCAVRAFTAGLLLRQAFPNPTMYGVEYGFDKQHGGEYLGENGSYLLMGHAVVRLTTPAGFTHVVESDKRGTFAVVSPDEIHDRYAWEGLLEGYQDYLAQADMGEVEIDPAEVLTVVERRLSVLA